MMSEVCHTKRKEGVKAAPLQHVVSVNSLNRYIEPLSTASSDIKSPSLLIADLTTATVPTLKVTNLTSSDSSVSFHYQPSSTGASMLDVTAVGGGGGGGSGPSVSVVDISASAAVFVPRTSAFQMVVLAPVSGPQVGSATVSLDLANIQVNDVLEIYLNNVLASGKNSILSSQPVVISLAGTGYSGLVTGFGQTAGTSVIFNAFGDGIRLVCTQSNSSTVAFMGIPVSGNPGFVVQSTPPVPPPGPGPTPPAPGSPPLFMPYVDIGLSNAGTGASNVLGMMQAAGINGITLAFAGWTNGAVSWSWTGSPQPGVAAIVAAGYKVRISFGGAAGVCPGFGTGDTALMVTQALLGLSQQIPGVDFDFDIESGTLASGVPLLVQGINGFYASTSYRKKANGTHVLCTFTIPTLVNNMTEMALSTSGVLTPLGQTWSTANPLPPVINLMTMDFAGTTDQTLDMSLRTQTAATTTYQWMQNTPPWNSLLNRYGIKSLSGAVEVTPMIGQNDTQDEFFGCNTASCRSKDNPGSTNVSGNASSLFAWARMNNVTLHFWSLGRDQPGNSTQPLYATTQIPDQTSYQFCKVFTGQMTG